MSAPVSIATARERAARVVAREQRAWAAHGGDDVRWELPLHPPSERAALADLNAAIGWAAGWRIDEDGVEVTWTTRRWPSAGAQAIPERCTVTGADAMARFAGRSVEREWRRLRDRAHALRVRLGDSAEVRSAVQRHGTSLARLSEADLLLLGEVVEWLVENPASGYRLRQVPIPGMHTKWLGAHRALVEALHSAATGRESLGLITSMPGVRVRFLDARLRPGGLADIVAPLDELAGLRVPARTVVVVENLETLLALPERGGVVAVHGSGYAVADAIPRLPWVAAARVLYWGDLDADGFAILHALRVRGVTAQSLLMDEETLIAFRDLWVADPGTAAPRALSALTAAEQRALGRIHSEGGIRLEQERVPWPYALAALDDAIGG
ncbi:hypothetical protein GCM10017576_15890 [Microbacterium barkeri]|uniref:Wadjet protein JetD C-terminal domain-containing protein n=1 Tax=Microbacterium barkeri TaxID=33917 RepID=A0A9W6H3D3_9MICO|nr:Wadjet anti-phage system protein JetD domain-containing protein [Microbacterium barkeri]MDI6943453.1 DUF2220 family protein [Microbacterium barkeri]MDR6878155.1 hypothetical protein [Microbacterium barkeri]GLJ61460.1 hypothetical protein GCM10017576_15890 [Microbacterium barkeri]